MEAVGSRLGRASSRYGAPTVFSGPVRKWKKKWVHVSSSSLHTTNTTNTHSHSTTTNTTTNNNVNSASSRLLLRRWTPITASSAAEDDGDPRDVSDEPPRRKFRYTPIAVLEEQKKAVIEKVEDELIADRDQLPEDQRNVNHEIHGMLNMNEMSEESKDSNIGELDLGLSYPGINSKTQ
ncbi:hypothetical protein HN51_061607 [Arachis hypogaea]|uniref:Uncharacterized protein n=2 Tax=Arachis TaxID=3817 RepID=A0A445AP34_ARAHY|nr:uncharacterized protein LOC107468146 [Arachis duranensis]XP_016178928.1 uncharacterized protein LOC107621393 [Arachis ipaensis]XP_025626874.1 uncharacterized protein LOC112720228 [Arachis hypogaea]QHO18907.1 uncharacterized protein DS421_11g324450 [Arachis hypogaea]RYR28144.1 hypothetical protein Ahy_B01g052260 [Arachis hypogaea]